MKKVMPNFNWRIELENVEVDAIGDDFILLDKPVFASTSPEPFKEAL